MKSIFVASLLFVMVLGCATTQERKVATQGHQFATGKTTESVVGAIVATLQEENITITTINEKFGIVNTGLQNVPAVTVQKWRGQPTFGLGGATWPVEISFGVSKTGDVTMKYCMHGTDPLRGHDPCMPYGADIATKYFEDKILSKL